jgi:Zn ribbon nucleic-acid-binding protein
MADNRSELIGTSENPILHVSTGLPACPACRESNNIEPLLRQDDVWHVRCLQCGYGFTFVQHAWPTSEERRRGLDRRHTPRPGRRSTDLPGPVSCTGCASDQVRGWLRTGDALWARCDGCGRVHRLPAPPYPGVAPTQQAAK